MTATSSPTSSPSLRYALHQRQRRAQARAEQLAEEVVGDPTNLDVQERLEEALDDFERYERLDRQLASPVVVRLEERTYRRGGPHSFFKDVVEAGSNSGGSRSAAERLARHAREERDAGRFEDRAVGSATFGGLMVPQYLAELTAGIPRGGRPLVNLVGPRPLPAEGLQIHLSTVTGGPAASAQSAENTAIGTNDPTASDVGLTVATVPAVVTVSRQIFDRATQGLDEWLLPDVVAAIDVKQESWLINGAGSGGETRGILNQSGVTGETYTDVTPTMRELVPHIGGALFSSSEARELPPDFVAMRPARWFWMVSAVDDAGQPAIPISTRPPDADSPFIGSIGGVGVLLTPGIPKNLGAGTNEDRIITGRSSDLIVLEGETVVQQAALARAESVDIICHRYVAMSAVRYAASYTVVSGTGMIYPSAP